MTVTTTRVATVRIFVVDDHVLVHQAIGSLLTTSSTVELVGGATRAGDALDRLAEAEPHVALLDITLPDGDGVSLARRIREEHPDVSCLMFTWHGDREALLAAALAGACGYVIKQLDSTGIVQAAVEAARGSLRLDPVAVTALVDRCHAAARDSGEGRRTRGPRLSARELAIFDDAVAGLTDSEIGARHGMSADTVNRFVSLIFTKFSLWSRVAGGR
ncbi:response regulator [uncultured Friedmanniella sp.]|uniref:response regulator n=1 Tax=uncultured Friedmanniella sp. TaxID=335381 RepID=UPI0035C9E720